MSFEQSKIFIGGHWVEPSTPRRIEMVSPSTEEYLGFVAEAVPEDVDAAVASARKAFDTGGWPQTPPARRAELLFELARLLEDRRVPLQEAFTREVGGPAAIAAAFMDDAIRSLTVPAEALAAFPFEETRMSATGAEVRVVREAIGVVGAIIPWNGPVTNACMKIGPALAAGCTVVVKAAPEGPGSLAMFAELVEEVGFPDGVVSILFGDRDAGEHLVIHPDVDKIAFTGSTAAGQRIMSLCGERVRNVTLELGGKSAGIIADDIPLEDVLPTLVPAGLAHSGQVCCAITRILVPRERQEELIAGLTESIAAWTVGDPQDASTVLGPLVAERQRDRVEEYIATGIAEGARLVIGGSRASGQERGWFVAPTVFADVDNSMRIAQEEIFGPVISVIPFDSIDEAVAIANDSDYGLSGAVYAEDLALAESVARRIRTGQVSINSFAICLSQPFGGYKKSGIGREGGPEGLSEFMEMKVLQGVG